VLSSTKGVKDRQSKESGDVEKEMENLNKKLHYLETTYKNATQHLEQIFNRGG
jgi:prefoldin subunit 1